MHWWFFLGTDFEFSNLGFSIRVYTLKLYVGKLNKNFVFIEYLLGAH